MQSEVRKIVIAGTAPAAAAAAVATAVSLRGSGISVTLLLAPNSGTSGPVDVFRGGPQGFHAKLGIEESKLCQQTNAVYGMGTRYRGLSEREDDVFVPLGTHGKTLRLVDFHHYARKLRAEDGPQDFNDWSAAAAVARTGRFDPTQADIEPVLRVLEYDVYVDSDSYLDSMVTHASALGVRIVRQSPLNAELNAEGMIESVSLGDGSSLHGDFFIDCSEDRFLIRHVTSDDELCDWSSWFACDQLVSLSAKSQQTPRLLTSIEAHDSGWLSQLSTRTLATGCFVYDSASINDGQAVEQLAQYLPGATPDDAQTACFRPGRYERHWEKNCVAIGTAAAVLAPMEISPLQLANSAILRLLAMLPRRKHSPMLAAEFNRMANVEIDSARDYQLLRLAVTNRQTGTLWQQTRRTRWPDSLLRRMDLFRSHGRFTVRDHEFFSKSNWISSFLNFGVWPEFYDPLADMIDEQRMRADLNRFRKGLQSRA
jgi:tryptophan halogenase